MNEKQEAFVLVAKSLDKLSNTDVTDDVFEVEDTIQEVIKNLSEALDKISEI